MKTLAGAGVRPAGPQFPHLQGGVGTAPALQAAGELNAPIAPECSHGRAGRPTGAPIRHWGAERVCL